MPIRLDCPCAERNRSFDFTASVVVDPQGNVVGTGDPFDKDALEEQAYQQALAFWNQVSQYMDCPEPCLISMTAVFDYPVLKSKVYATAVVPGNPPVVLRSISWTATVSLTISAECRKPEDN
jgi:hypothetical protein